MSARHPCAELVSRRLEERARAWFDERHERAGRADFSAGDFAAAFAGIGRRAGSAPLALDASERHELEVAGVLVPEGWPLAAVARAALLLQCARALSGERFCERVFAQFKTGDNAERTAVLKALPLLPSPERFVELGVEACRSHVQDVFEAIACENPYPARHFPEPNFNQLVLKAFFTGVAVRRIVGLSERITPELVRMANAYASERRAAGRSVPSDLGAVTGEEKA